jgi:hypothetical protein
MNTEERHRLNTNELGQTVQAVGSQFEQHGSKIVGAICAVLLIAAGIVWWVRQSTATSTEAWSMLQSAKDVEALSEVADKFAGTAPGRWGRLRQAETYLQTGLPNILTDREAANIDLKKAKASYQQLVDDAQAEPTIRERALWGLAFTTETMSDGDTSKAIECYQSLLKEFPETFYKPDVEARIASLKTGGSKEFYAWFSKQNPKRSDPRPNDSGLKNDLESLLPGPGEMPPENDAKSPDASADGAAKPNPAKDGDKVPDLKADKEGEAKTEEKTPDEKKSEEKKEEDKKD